MLSDPYEPSRRNRISKVLRKNEFFLHQGDQFGLFVTNWATLEAHFDFLKR
jgi:hypothetical protein